MKKIKFTTLTILFFVILSQQTFSQKTNADSIIIKANALIIYKHFTEAIKLLSEGIKLNPRNSEYYYKRATVFYKQNKFENAISDFLTVEKLIPQTVNYELAESYSQLKNVEKSIYYLSEYLKKSNKLSESEIKQNTAFNFEENSKQWIDLWKNTNYSKDEILINEAIYEANRYNYAEAFVILDNLLAKKKEKFQIYEVRGDLHFATKDYKNAISDYTKSLKIKQKNSICYKKLAETYFLIQKYSKSKDNYLLYLEKNPNEIEVYFEIAKADFEQKNYEESEKYINEYLKYYFENLDALFLYAQLKLIENNNFEALKLFNKCIEKDKSKPEYFAARGEAYFQSKMYEYAERDFNQSLDLQPISGEIYFKRGLSRFENNNLKGACSDWQKAESYRYFKASDYLQKYCKSMIEN